MSAVHRETGEIAWAEWGPEVFARAKAEEKPILLHIGATWCHWCHVMDLDTWSRPNVARIVAERFIAVRVDTDHRPDVNERYNQGGWPSIAILDAGGEVLVGRLYMPPHEAIPLLLSATDPAQRWSVAVRPEEPPGAPIVSAEVYAAVQKAYDPYHGGFGEIEKFPHTQVTEWLLDRRQRGQDEGGMLAPSLAGMAGRGLVDVEEGGFFRYCTQDDWTVPHYEKLLEDQARLVRLFVRADVHRPVVAAAVRWMIGTLWRDEVLAFAGSMDADEAYYARPLATRGEPPSVDPTVVAGWNGLAITALVHAGCAWERPGLLSLARRAAGSLLTLVDAEGAVHRTRGGIVGLAEDQASVAQAFLVLAQVDGDSAWLDAGARVLGWARSHLVDGRGGFMDSRPLDEGLLRQARRSLHANAALGEAAWRFGVISGDASWLAMATEAGEAALAEGDRYGFMAAPAAALAERLTRTSVLVKVNDDGLTRRLYNAVDSEVIVLRVRQGVPTGKAMACGPKSCALPTSDIEELRRQIEQLRR